MQCKVRRGTFKGLDLALPHPSKKLRALCVYSLKCYFFLPPEASSELDDMAQQGKKERSKGAVTVRPSKGSPVDGETEAQEAQGCVWGQSPDPQAN